MNLLLVLSAALVNLVTLFALIFDPSLSLALGYLITAAWTFGMLFLYGNATKDLTEIRDNLLDLRATVAEYDKTCLQEITELKTELSNIRMSMRR